MKVIRSFLLTATLACDLPEVTSEGIHVRVAADHGLEICAGTLVHMDRFVSDLSAEFGVSPPTGDSRFKFYWLEAADFSARSGCSEGRDGCERGGEVFSVSAPLNHELVHEVTHQLGHAPPFFVEGLAVVYQGLGAILRPPESSVSDVLRTLEATDSMAVDYSAAGAFTAFLIERHGLDAFLAVYAGLERRSDRNSIDATFREVLGVSLENSEAEFRAAYDSCSKASLDAKLVECAAPEIPWDGAHLTTYQRLACDREDAIGPFDGRDLVVLYTLMVDTPGLYEIKVVSERLEHAAGPQHAISLVPCGGCRSGPPVLVSAGGEAATVMLTSGPHSLRLHATAMTPTELGLRIQRINLNPP